MASKESGKADPGENSDAPQFAFVHHHLAQQHDVRSHAMREHWKKRHKSKQKKSVHQLPRQLLPNTGQRLSDSAGSSGASASASSSTSTSLPGSDPTIEEVTPGLVHLQLRPGNHQAEDGSTRSSSSDNEAAVAVPPGGIPTQVITGVNHALAGSRLDPFDMFPVKLTAQHHKLLHHWLSTHATMMFEELPMSTFNPMRDVWFPLDFSNAASFNAIMAHSAAHLARMQGIKSSTEALKYKAEAMRIVTGWLCDPKMALSDEMLAAVIRLLTYARYWGTEAEWKVHYEGLQRMIEAKGGIMALQRNWRLELVTFLISLMSKPSWFDSSNHISELSWHPRIEAAEASANAPNPVMRNTQNLHRVRCLWLISFVQDMRNLTGGGLAPYAAAREAVDLLQRDLRQHTLVSLREEVCTDREFTRLACIFFISVLLKGSVSTVEADATAAATIPCPPSDLAILDDFLNNTRDSWQGSSAENLYDALFRVFPADILPDGERKTDYVLHITNVLRPMSGEARRGVERCLLQILWHAQGHAQGRGQGMGLEDDSWTPDTVLSSLHGG